MTPPQFEVSRQLQKFAARNESGLISFVAAISFDVHGTLLLHNHSVAEAYAECAKWAKVQDLPTADELRPAFKRAYREALSVKLHAESNNELCVSVDSHIGHVV